MCQSVLIVDNRQDRLIRYWAVLSQKLNGISFDLKNTIEKDQFEKAEATLVLCHYGNSAEVWQIEANNWSHEGKRVVFFSDSNSDDPDKRGEFVHISARYLRKNFAMFIQEQFEQ